MSTTSPSPYISSENRSLTSTVTVEEIGNRFKFVAREEQMREYRELIQSAFENWRNYHTKPSHLNRDYRKRLSIPLIGGTGKTRF